MNLKRGKNYKVRILQMGDFFYPQIYVKSFWHTGWYFIDMEKPLGYVGTIKPPSVKTWNESMEKAEEIISGLKEKFKEDEIKIHNEREEYF